MAFDPGGVIQPVLVGVLNVTPDSFSDGGRFADPAVAVEAGCRMIDQGAGWIDVGGESTRPGCSVVPEAEEKARVVPVIRALAQRLGARGRISIDTYKAGTAAAALDAGASVVNDISGGVIEPDILQVVAGAGATIVLGHLRGRPGTMMEGIAFDDVVDEVCRELQARVDAAWSAGVEDIWVDPGIGFGKDTAQNLALLAHLQVLHRRLRVPIMVGVSNKRFVGELTGRAVPERFAGSAAAVAAAVLAGAAALRVHDVDAMRDVIAVSAAIRAAGFQVG